MPPGRPVLAATLCLVLLATSPNALADDGDIEETWLSPRDLAASLTAEADAIDAPLPLGGEDFAVQTGTRINRAALTVGRARVDAARHTVDRLPHLGLTVHELVAGGSALLMLESERHGPATRWSIQALAREWLSLEAAIERLRSLVAGVAPDRVCPVEGETDFHDDWHDARPWGRTHKGNDVHAETGTPVLAIEAGTVIQANWHWAGGRQIYLTADATGDVYFYAHLDTWSEWIWTGTTVEAGDVIGTVGRSGNAHTPHLHFGWMPGSRTLDLENLQNPYSLLVELCV